MSVMTEQEFQTKVFEKLDTVEKSQERLAKLEQAHTKGLEELTSVKTKANETFEQVTKRIEAVQSQLAQVQRGGLSPVQRFCASPERRAWIMGCFKQAMGMPLSPVEKTAVTAVDSGIGGAVSPQETSALIYDALLSYGQWSTLGVMPVGARTQILPLVTARPTAYWVAQGAQITEGAMTGSSVTLTIKEAAAWIPVARALLEDAEGDFSGYLLEQLAQAVAYRLDWACFAADGTDDTTDGAYTGIASGGTAATAANGNTTVANLDLEDFVRCLTTVDAGVLQRPAKWWVHPTVLAKIVQIRDSNGRPIFQTALEAPAPGAIGSILGYPVIVAGAMPSTDSAGSVVAAFGDPQGCAVGVRKQFELARSDEFQFDYNRSCFRAIVRAGVVIKSATSFAKLTLAAA